MTPAIGAEGTGGAGQKRSRLFTLIERRGATTVGCIGLAVTLVSMSVTAGVVCTFYVGMGLRTWRRHRTKLRERRVQQWCADAIGLLADDFRTGSSPLKALLSLVDEVCANQYVTVAERRAWLAVAGAAKTGEDVCATLRLVPGPFGHLCERLAAAWALVDSGAPLSALASAIEREARDQTYAAAQRRGEAAAGYATAWTLAALPLVGLGLGGVLGADPLHLLLYTRLGAVCALGGVFLQLCGWVWVHRIVADEPLATRRTSLNRAAARSTRWWRRRRSWARARLTTLVRSGQSSRRTFSVQGSSRTVRWFAAIVAGLVVIWLGGFHVVGLALGGGVGIGIDRFLARLAPAAQQRERECAAQWLPFTAVLFGALVRAGWPSGRAVTRLATAVPSPLADQLRSVGAALELGTPVEVAWQTHLANTPSAAALCRAVIRSHESGTALAGACDRLADRLRTERTFAASARAGRVSVAMVAPLTSCFLPAFVLVGVIPLIMSVLTGALYPT